MPSWPCGLLCSMTPTTHSVSSTLCLWLDCLQLFHTPLLPYGLHTWRTFSRGPSAFPPGKCAGSNLFHLAFLPEVRFRSLSYTVPARAIVGSNSRMRATTALTIGVANDVPIQ